MSKKLSRPAISDDYNLDMIGETEAARPYYERALTICEAKLGPEHPHTQAVRGNLERLGG